MNRGHERRKGKDTMKEVYSEGRKQQSLGRRKLTPPLKVARGKEEGRMCATAEKRDTKTRTQEPSKIIEEGPQCKKDREQLFGKLQGGGWMRKKARPVMIMNF